MIEAGGTGEYSGALDVLSDNVRSLRFLASDHRGVGDLFRTCPKTGNEHRKEQS